jgi:hypothetical protein
MLQDVVTRLAANGSQAKGWAITIAGVILGFTVNSRNETLALLAVITSLCFWGLDAYYLRAERLFRELFARARRNEVELFEMNATGKTFKKSTRETIGHPLRAPFRPTLAALYLMLISAAIATYLIVQHQTEPRSEPRPRLQQISNVEGKLWQRRLVSSSVGGPNRAYCIVLPPRDDVQVHM